MRVTRQNSGASLPPGELGISRVPDVIGRAARIGLHDIGSMKSSPALHHDLVMRRVF
jgi:hypothetical protein